jgi:hypothetical protein
LGPEFRVECCATLQAELRALFGEAILNGDGADRRAETAEAAGAKSEAA